MTQRTEIVVIGSGPGGAITACTLAEAGRQVTLAEDGPFLAQNSCHPFSIEEIEQKYRNGGVTTTFGNTKVAYAEGRCVGGGSEINSGLYHRTPAEVLERWRREFGLVDASEEEMRQHFESCERDLSVSYLPGPAPEASLRLYGGATALGWHAIEVPRWFRYDRTPAPIGERQSMSRTYVQRALAAGCCLVPDTRIRMLSRSERLWRLEGTTLESSGARRAFRLDAETVFVCGGTVQTALLLRRSGLRRNIGNTLQIHPTVKVIARFDHEVNNEQTGVPVHQIKQFAPEISMGCSISTRAFLALGLAGFPGRVAALEQSWRNLAVYYAMIAPAGGGLVRSIPGFDDALVRYRFAPADYRSLALGLRRLCQALVAGGAVELFPALAGANPITHPDQLDGLATETLLARSSLMTIHLFSSCPMGENQSKCAADSYGKVHGVPNLYVSDASLLCSAPGVNPQGTVMAFARRNALRFLDSARPTT